MEIVLANDKVNIVLKVVGEIIDNFNVYDDPIMVRLIDSTFEISKHVRIKVRVGRCDHQLTLHSEMQKEDANCGLIIDAKHKIYYYCSRGKAYRVSIQEPSITDLLELIRPYVTI